MLTLTNEEIESRLNHPELIMYSHERKPLPRFKQAKVRDGNDKGKYCSIVFMQSDTEDVKEPLRILEENGLEAVIDYLSQWDFGGESEYDIPIGDPWGKSDTIYRKGNYVLSYNLGLGYIGLSRKLI